MRHVTPPLDADLVVKLQVFGGKAPSQLLNLGAVTVTVIHCIGHHLGNGQPVQNGGQLIQHGGKVRPLLGELSDLLQQLLNVHVRQRLYQRQYVAVIQRTQHGRNIAMALVKNGYHKKDTPLQVEVRNKMREAIVTRLPFVPNKFYRG